MTLPLYAAARVADNERVSMPKSKASAERVAVSKAARRPVRGGMTVNAYSVLCRCVEEGVNYGYRRAHKHVSKPDEEAVRSAIEEAVIGTICEMFAFDSDETE